MTTHTHCYKCGQQSQCADYCPHCGSPMELKEFIAATVKANITDLIKDRDILEAESSHRVFESAWKILKLHGTILGIVASVSLTIVGGVIAWTGHSLREASDTAKAYIDGETGHLKQEIETARTQLKEASQLKPDLDALKEKEGQISADLEIQKQTLSSKEDLIKAIFQTHTIQILKLERNSTGHNFLVVPPPSGGKVTMVYLLLENAPVHNAIQLQYGIFNQYANHDAWATWKNVLGIRFGDTVEKIYDNPQFAISYFADKKRADLVQSLSLKDGHPYADAVPLPYFDEKHPDKMIATEETIFDDDTSSTPPPNPPSPIQQKP